MSDIVCPVCKQNLNINGNCYRCEGRHCFDIAKEGYVNLLAGNHKAGESIGDNKDMALSRKKFLEKGYFSPLADKITELIVSHGKSNPTVCDICCGEGWYSNEIIKKIPCNMLCFDLSKEMVRLGAKRKNGATFFVANLASIPLADKSVCYVQYVPRNRWAVLWLRQGHLCAATVCVPLLPTLPLLLYDQRC